jgi:ERCC4-type nuclease
MPSDTSHEPLILIDSRERKPWKFQIPTETATLLTGDYSLKGYEDEIGIERKTLDDLWICLTSERERFQKELERSLQYKKLFVLFEARWQDVLDGRYRSDMRPKAAWPSIHAFSIRFCPFIAVETPGTGSRICSTLLTRYFRDAIEGRVLAKSRSSKKK